MEVIVNNAPQLPVHAIYRVYTARVHYPHAYTSWLVQECIIWFVSHSSNTYKCGVCMGLTTIGQVYLHVVVSCTTGQYHDIAPIATGQYIIILYCHGGTFCTFH